MHIERCSCNALIFTFSAKRAAEWRVSHNHDIPPAAEYGDMPTIHESASYHERAFTFGFTAEHMEVTL